MTTNSDFEYSYVAILVDFNVMRVIKIVIVIKIVYNSIKSNNSDSYSNNGNKIVIIVYNGKKSNNSDSNNYSNKGHSTTMCTLIYKEIINQYINNGSDVYSCLLDASKAFDRVH